MHHARSRLAPLTFRDTEVPAHESPVAKKHVSATAKIAYKVNQDGTPITSLRALFEELDTRTRNTCLIPGTDVTFTKTSIPTDIQRHAFELIGAKIPS